MPADAAVPLDLLARLLASIAGVIHDRPVQDLVAGRLWLDTARTTGEEALWDRGIDAVGRAGVHARDIMWALDEPSVRLDHLDDDLAEMGARVGGPEVVVQVDGVVDAGALSALSAALHPVLVDVLLGGGRAHRIGVRGHADSLHATVAADHGVAGAAPRPWLELATIRVVAAGGRMGATVRGATTVTELAVPVGTGSDPRSGGQAPAA